MEADSCVRPGDGDVRNMSKCGAAQGPRSWTRCNGATVWSVLCHCNAETISTGHETPGHVGESALLLMGTDSTKIITFN